MPTEYTCRLCFEKQVVFPKPLVYLYGPDAGHLAPICFKCYRVLDRDPEERRRLWIRIARRGGRIGRQKILPARC
jgi:hypothetical protein